MPIKAKRGELRKAFDRHCKFACSSNCQSGYLVYFYGIECGLKSIYLRNNRLNETNEHIHGIGHRLDDLIKELKLPGIYAPPHVEKKHSGNLNISEVHQAWRYGIDIKMSSELDFITWLRKMHLYIRGDI